MSIVPYHQGRPANIVAAALASPARAAATRATARPTASPHPPEVAQRAPDDIPVSPGADVGKPGKQLIHPVGNGQLNSGARSASNGAGRYNRCSHHEHRALGRFLSV